MANRSLREIRSQLLGLLSDLERYSDGREVCIAAYDNMGGYTYLDLDRAHIEEGADGNLYITID